MGLRYACNLCNYSATTKHHLEEHQKSLHFNVRFPCKSCDYQATKKSNLNVHFKRVHYEPDNKTCIDCNKVFKNSLTLAKHRKSLHSTDQPLYNCDLCPYQSIHKQNLKTHKDNVHKKTGRIRVEP